MLRVLKFESKDQELDSTIVPDSQYYVAVRSWQKRALAAQEERTFPTRWMPRELDMK
jgi:hypothetical protein